MCCCCWLFCAFDVRDAFVAGVVCFFVFDVFDVLLLLMLFVFCV